MGGTQGFALPGGVEVEGGERIKGRWIPGRGEGGGINYLLPCINAEHSVGLVVKWWRSLWLGSLVRGDDIDEKFSDCNHVKYLDLLRLLTNC